MSFEDLLSGGLERLLPLPDHRRTTGLMSAAELRELPKAATELAKVATRQESLKTHCREAGVALRHSETQRLVDEMPIERLQDVTAGGLRLGPLKGAGWHTVGQVLAHEHQLTYVDGVGDVTATRLRGAAHAIWKTTFDEMPVRIDVKRRSAAASELLRRLSSWDALRRRHRGLDDDLRAAAAFHPIVDAVKRGVTDVLVTSSEPEGLNALQASVQRLLTSARPALSAQLPVDDVWEDFLARPADYFTLLAELGFALEDEEKVHGDLPTAIVEAVRALDLKTEHLNVSLRGYQSFAARFAVVQKRVIIGDEMGLGKTVEALAVLAHLRGQGKTHFLVICPAAVVTNWMREVSGKSTLLAHRLHGYERDAAVRNWRRRGGVAITTFESLGWFLPAAHGVNVDCVVVDEAHYIKNPFAKRSERAARLIDGSDHAVLMTGTPLENRVAEFRQLVHYLRPDLARDVVDFAPHRFRKQVAPAYLRRNQEDVLIELPERVEVEEWLPLSQADESRYRRAVAEGNFMAMRQAAMLAGRESHKVERLLQIVDEARDNGRKVIVFSYFRSVLEQVAQVVHGRVHGPLTGSVSAPARQTMVDDFTRSPGGAVLVSQIQAGGVGLNIQAASVVVICEPQIKPSMEDQAIARAHRMGQVQSVQVHRLLTDQGVDTRIVDLLAVKRRVFDEFARASETARSTPEAFDLSEGELARQIVAEERQRLAG